MTTTTTTKNKVPGPSPTEQALLGTGLSVAQQQLAAIQAQAGQQTIANQATTPLIPGQTAQLVGMQQQAEGHQAGAAALEPYQTAALQKELANIQGGNAVTPEQTALINQAIDSQLQLGASDISAQSQDALTQLRDILAPSRGLRSTDTPILDRGDLIGQAGVRSYNDLVTALRGRGAEAMLSYPLQANALTTTQDTGLLNFSSARDQFAQQLAESAFQNRLRLTGQTSSQGLNLATGSPSVLPGLESSLASTRGGSQTSTAGGLGTILNIGGGILGGLGGLASGIGGTGGIIH